MRKITRKNKRLGKKIPRKNKHLGKRTSKNRKMKGGYKIEKKVNSYGNAWEQVVFDEEDKEKIRQYLKANPGSSSTTIRDELFPGMDEKNKNNAAYEIQVVLGRAYAGR